MKIILSTFSLFFFCFFLACGHDVPFNPAGSALQPDTTSPDSSTAKPDTTKPNTGSVTVDSTPVTPRLIPLASGASWEYSLIYSYSSQGTSAGPCVSQHENGRLRLYVVKEEIYNGGREYELKVELMIDSLHYAYSYECYSGAHFSGDTVYTEYNAIDTTFYRTIVFCNDTLWYKNVDSLHLFLTDSIAAGSLLNATLFNAARYDICDRQLPYIAGSSLPHQLVYKGEYSLGWGYQMITAIVRPSDGGLYSLQSYAREGDISHYSKELKYYLLSYTPGQAVTE